MRKSILGLSAIAFFAAATPAMAQDDDGLGLTITGTATVVSDYRFRGISQSSEDFAIQGGFTATHESGFYAGVWGSSISFAQGTEIDAIGGFSHELIPGLTGDVGFTYYIYPNKTLGLTANEIIEPYASLSGTVGPVWGKVGIAYAPKQEAYLSAVQNRKFDNTYLWGDAAVSIPNTPLKVTGHVGYTANGYLRDALNDGVTSRNHYLDFGLGATASYKALTFGVNFVSTDIPSRFPGGTPSYREEFGADSTVVFSIGAAF